MMIPLNPQKRRTNMSILSDIRNIYNNIPKQEEKKYEATPMNQELLDKTMEHLNKNPLVAPNISKKENS
jgi:hypothetical protein